MDLSSFSSCFAFLFSFRGAYFYSDASCFPLSAGTFCRLLVVFSGVDVRPCRSDAAYGPFACLEPFPRLLLLSILVFTAILYVFSGAPFRNWNCPTRQTIFSIFLFFRSGIIFHVQKCRPSISCPKRENVLLANIQWILFRQTISICSSEFVR